MLRIISSCSLLFLLILPTLGFSETRYVSDQLVITVREGKDLASPRLTTLRTDTPVEVLEEDDRFLKVRTEDGLEGYIQKQYLSTERPKKEIIKELQSELSKLKKQQHSLDQTKTSLMSEEKTLRVTLAQQEKSLNEARKEVEKITTEYESLKERSGNVLDIVAERDRLEAENASVQQQIESLKAENSTLLRTGMIKWFLAGGSVFLVGWLAGKISRKKRRF